MFVYLIFLYLTNMKEFLLNTWAPNLSMNIWFIISVKYDT